jgi:hypothetical protein
MEFVYIICSHKLIKDRATEATKLISKKLVTTNKHIWPSLETMEINLLFEID